jgi:hypothetical protein
MACKFYLQLFIIFKRKCEFIHCFNCSGQYRSTVSIFTFYQTVVGLRRLIYVEEYLFRRFYACLTNRHQALRAAFFLVTVKAFFGAALSPNGHLTFGATFVPGSAFLGAAHIPNSHLTFGATFAPVTVKAFFGAALIPNGHLAFLTT